MTRLLIPAALTAALVFPATVGAATASLTATASLKTKKRDGLSFIQKGTIKTNAFGSGKVTQRSTISRGKVTSKFTAKLPGGKVRGRASGKVSVGLSVSYSGKAQITGGTGKFAKASGKNLSFSGSAPLSGSSSTITLRGNVSY